MAPLTITVVLEECPPVFPGVVEYPPVEYPPVELLNDMIEEMLIDPDRESLEAIFGVMNDYQDCLGFDEQIVGNVLTFKTFMPRNAVETLFKEIIGNDTFNKYKVISVTVDGSEIQLDLD